MGLDVTAYEKLGEFIGPYSEELQNKLDEDWSENEENYIHIFSGDFPERLDGLAPGYYRTEGEEMGFRAGAYSAYNRWRGRLAEIAWGVKYEVKFENMQMTDTLRAWEREGQPFFELVWFTDCDGVLGPKTCAKLAKDFAEYEAKAEAASIGDMDAYHQHDIEGSAFMHVYRKFKEAFELAANSGIVKYH